MIGGAEAGQAVARIIVKTVVQGPTFCVAVCAAAHLKAKLPPAVVLGLLRAADPRIRAGACRCARRSADTIAVLVDLLDDLNDVVRNAAACALGRMGRAEARPVLVRLLGEGPTIEVIDAITAIADAESIVVLGRIARDRPDLASTVLDALDAIDHPRAERTAEAILSTRRGGR